ncbi:LOW QUALITY PROTEIN: uncharacterized protein ACIGJ3_010967 [Trichechus inunguis]
MKTENQTFRAEFGLFQYRQMNTVVFVAIAVIFSVSLMGNIILIHPIRLDTRLHTPMYFLLSQLSFVDMMYISTTVPKMTANFLSSNKTLTFLGCEIQTFLLLTLGATETLLLGFMSYDQYVAICHPLHYPVPVFKMICFSTVTCAWVCSFSNALIYTLYVFQLLFCKSQLINHFFCEFSSILALVCQDTSQYEYTILFSGLIILLLPFMAILASYVWVLIEVYQMSSGKGQTKAVSRYSSHLIVVSLFYGTTLSTYTRPHSLHDPKEDKVVVVFYSIIAPLLNLFIYNLRNKEVMGTMKKLLGYGAMENANDTTGINFILLELFNHTQIHLFLFAMVLMIFITSLMGNALMIILTHVDLQLHTPMHFLLSQISLTDMMLVSTIVPRMAANYLMDTGSISPTGCGAQIFLFLTLGGSECFLLVAMSCDCYVAICHPLCYTILMSQRLCLLMTAGSWLLGGVDGLMQAGATLSFPYCHSWEINHFFCEVPSLVCLACADTTIFEFFMYVCYILMPLIPLSLILASYSLILAAVLSMQSTTAKKDFMTRSSHLEVVGLFYGTLVFIYMGPKTYCSVDHNEVVSAFYTIFTPVLNPFIYSVRNKEVKGALRRWLEKHLYQY